MTTRVKRNSISGHQQNTLLAEVTKHYLTSYDFNGIPTGRLGEALRLTLEEVRQSLRQPIKDELVFLNTRGNYHIKAFDEPPIKEQLKELEKVDLQHSCVYPTTTRLRKVVDRKRYEGRPFTLRLALGEPQLKPLFFDLDVLEAYRNDPRMRYWHNDIAGGIWITDEACVAKQAQDRDKVFLQTFGFAYDDEMNRAVAVYLRYLSDLTPEHQRIWEARLLSGEYSLHPDYYRTSISGQFPERLSLCEAFIAEIRVINNMTKAMGKRPLFRTAYDSSSRPREFELMIRPTQRELNSFIHLLDKLLSENINKDFFRGDLLLEEEIQRAKGKMEIRQKGTLRLLEDWLRKKVIFPNQQPFLEMITIFKKIRNLRQKPAHSVAEDQFDQKFFKQQREILLEAYTAIRTLRQIFANDPRAASVKVEEALYKGKIWSY